MVKLNFDDLPPKLINQLMGADKSLGRERREVAERFRDYLLRHGNILKEAADVILTADRTPETEKVLDELSQAYITLEKIKVGKSVSEESLKNLSDYVVSENDKVLEVIKDRYDYGKPNAVPYLNLYRLHSRKAKEEFKDEVEPNLKEGLDSLLESSAKLLSSTRKFGFRSSETVKKQAAVAQKPKAVKSEPSPFLTFWEWAKDRYTDKEKREKDYQRRDEALKRKGLKHLGGLTKILRSIGSGFVSTVIRVTLGIGKMLGSFLSTSVSVITGVIGRIPLLGTILGALGLAGGAGLGKYVYDKLFSKESGSSEGSGAGKAAAVGAGAFAGYRFARNPIKTVKFLFSKAGAKFLGGLGGAYTAHQGVKTIDKAKGKRFLEGGLNSRAAGYAEAVGGASLAGAAVGSAVPVVGTAVGAAVGGLIGGVYALVEDNKSSLKRFFERNNKLVKALPLVMASGPIGTSIGGLIKAVNDYVSKAPANSNSFIAGMAPYSVSAQSSAAPDTQDSTGSPPTGGFRDIAAKFLKKEEGFTKSAGWDVNHMRLGYGSDTRYVNGRYGVKVKKGDTTDEASATKDLYYRINNFVKIARKRLGSSFDQLPENTKAALISYIYNFGDVRKYRWGDSRNKAFVAEMKAAVIAKDVKRIAALIRSANSGGRYKDALEKRRHREAALAEGGFGSLLPSITMPSLPSKEVVESKVSPVAEALAKKTKPIKDMAKNAGTAWDEMMEKMFPKNKGDFGSVSNTGKAGYAASSSAMKGTLRNIPFVPDDLNLLNLTVYGLL